MTIEGLNYFVGKVCTIFTTKTNWDLKQEQCIDYFVGRIELINQFGLCIVNVINGTKTFVMNDSIVAISEELEVKEDVPIEETLQKYEDHKKEVFGQNPGIYKPPATPKTPVPPLNTNFIDLDAMTKLAASAKEKLKK